MPITVCVSIYALTSVKAQVFTSIFMTVIYVPLCVENGGFVVYLTSRCAFHAGAVFLGLVYRRAEEWERRTNCLEQHLAYQEFLRTQEILHDLLPSKVVRKMRDNPDAKSLCETRLVVVLVLDLCNFTKISQEGTPLQLIGYINSIFSAFDREVKKQGLFKMDTIGDAYVAAGLLNSLDPAEATERCAAMIRLSQRMLKVLEDHREVSGKDLRCRIGISTGEVYAGVLGRLQPRYHLFGEPMRIAEQLEQRCAVDGVHVSAPVMESLSSRPELQEESAHGRTPTASTRVRSLCDLAEVDIAVDDDGRPFVRRRSSAESRFPLAAWLPWRHAMRCGEAEQLPRRDSDAAQLVSTPQES
ncbi:nucleotide cyclase [Baffinella frigidus]|nr:nucleotide cyclase [Cryptophyta sp. CCMP2293]